MRRVILCVAVLTVLFHSLCVQAEAQPDTDTNIADRLQRFFSLTKEDVDDPAIRMMINADTDNFISVLSSHPDDVNLRYNNVSYLHIAALMGRPVFIQLLIDNGADVNDVYGPGKMTPLHVAVGLGLQDAAETLLSRGADANSAMAGGVYPLHLAVKNADEKTMSLLLDGGALVDAANNKGRTALSYALAAKAFDVAQILYDAGANMNIKMPGGKTLAHEAVERNDPQTIDWLAAAGADINMRDNRGITPVYLAVQQKKKDAFDAMIRNGCDVNLATKNGFTPLMESVFGRDRLDYMKKLIDAGAYIEASREVNGQTALTSAVAFGGPDEVRTLLEAGAYAERTNPYGNTLFHTALSKDNMETFMFLLDYGLDPNSHMGEGWPVLISACWQGKLPFVRVLLDHGVDINFQSDDKDTALFAAVRKDHADTVKFLLENGADPAIRDHNNLTPWHKAVDLRNQPMADLIASYMTESQMQPTNRVWIYFDHDAPLAPSVSVVGYFNEWRSDRAPMTKREDDGWWYVEVELFPGTYAYKLDVGPSWILDPLNTNKQEDSSFGSENSVFHTSERLVGMRPARPVSKADNLVPVMFVYENDKARRVSVAGEFNGWNTQANPMRRKGRDIWYCQVHLAPGEYMYKIIVDGDWILDPKNKLTAYGGDVRNSLIKVSAPEKE